MLQGKYDLVHTVNLFVDMEMLLCQYYMEMFWITGKHNTVSQGDFSQSGTWKEVLTESQIN